VAGKVDAVVADKTAVAFYQRIKPGNFSRLQALEMSEPFPASLVAYREGALSEDLINTLRKGLLKANKNDRGQDLMATWNITSFEPVPADYQKSLEEIVKAYPAK
jgi:ABC-type phosphate/phosphonate transport system substrate-binding protein